jgi:hypothetical protein
MQEMLIGALSGATATVPMTAFLKAGFLGLPSEDQYPLPPRIITMRVAEKAGVKEKLDEQEKTGLTYAAHYGYGVAMGALYGLTAGKAKGPAALKGMGFGLGVWAGSYLGVLPAAGLLQSAKDQPPARNALMIAAHLIWGAAVGVATESLKGLSRDR